MSRLLKVLPVVGDSQFERRQAYDDRVPGVSAGASRVIAVTGLKAEAKVAAGPHVHVLSGGGDGAQLARDLEAVAANAGAIISFGVAGGLAPGLVPGAVLVAHSIIFEDGQVLYADPAWSRALSESLGAAIVDLAGVDQPVSDSLVKRALHLRTGAHAVDMESHIAARIAAHRKIPFAAIRVIADPAERRLPNAALVAMRPDGAIAIGALIHSLFRHPAQIPALMQTARDARAACASLIRSRRMLSAGFGFTNPGEPAPSG
jgi:adenosylhomocysteine nucleosidase